MKIPSNIKVIHAMPAIHIVSLLLYHNVIQLVDALRMGPIKRNGQYQETWCSFQEAKEALNCGLVVVMKEDLDSGEGRYIYLGMCKKLKILVVVVTYREEDITRIISARKANKKEREFYETQL